MTFSLKICMRRFLIVAIVTSAVIVFLQATTAVAQLSNFSDDFEDIVDSSDPNALHDGWIVGANVYSIDTSNYYHQGAFQYNYFAFPAPNGTGGFSNVTDPNTSDPPVGNRGVVVFSDYLNADHDPNGNNFRLESVFFREQTVGAGDVGKTVKFEFVAQPDNLEGDTRASGFIKTFVPGFSAITSYLAVDTTILPSGQSLHSISLPITPGLVGNPFQIGFDNWADSFEGSGVDYDNISLTINDTFGSYSEDFESVTTAQSANEEALSRSGWKAFGAVFDSGENFKFQYGPFGAPNNTTPSTTTGFSGINTSESNGGTQSLSTFSDYNCCTDAGAEGHANGTDIVDSSVFQEVIVGTADEGRQVEFKFDAKIPSSSAIAFDPNSSDATFFIRSIDSTTGAPIADSLLDAEALGVTSSGWTTGSVLFDITSAHVGHLLQFGVTSRSSDFAGTELLLDNISFDDSSVAADNADFDGDGVVTGLDFLIYQQNIGLTGQVDNSNGDANGDGVVGSADLVIYEAQYGTSPFSASINAVPEPSTLLLGSLAAGLLMRRRSR